MKLTKDEAKKMLHEFGMKKLPRSGRQYLKVNAKPYLYPVEVLENCNGEYYYGWMNEVNFRQI